MWSFSLIMAQPWEELEREKEKVKETHLLCIFWQVHQYEEAFLRPFLVLYSILLLLLHSLHLLLCNWLHWYVHRQYTPLPLLIAHHSHLLDIRKKQPSTQRHQTHTPYRQCCSQCPQGIDWVTIHKTGATILISSLHSRLISNFPSSSLAKHCLLSAYRISLLMKRVVMVRFWLCSWSSSVT